MENKNLDIKTINLGARNIPKLRNADFPNADAIVHEDPLAAALSPEAVYTLLVNPSTPDDAL